MTLYVEDEWFNQILEDKDEIHLSSQFIQKE